MKIGTLKQIINDINREKSVEAKILITQMDLSMNVDRYRPNTGDLTIRLVGDPEDLRKLVNSLSHINGWNTL